jgi:PAS domain S-box-containing protein
VYCIWPAGFARHVGVRASAVYCNAGGQIRTDIVPEQDAAPPPGGYQRPEALSDRTADDAVIARTMNGVITEWNAGAERLYGYTADDAVGRSVDIIVPEDRVEELARVLKRVAGGERIENLETLRRRRDGSHLWVSISYSPIYDADGEVVGATSITRDVTRKLELQERLARQEEQLRFVLDAAQVGTWEWNMATGTVEWSPQLEVLHGLEPGSFLGTYEAFVSLIHPQDRQRVLAAVASAVETGGQFSVEFRIIPPDGAIRWIAGQGRAYRDGSGRPVRMVGLGWDVTDRHQAQAELQRSRDELAAILSGVAEGITVRDPDGKLLYANEAAARLRGYPDVRSWQSTSPDVYAARFRTTDERGAPVSESNMPTIRALKTLRPAEGAFRYVFAETGEERWSLVRATAVQDESGEVLFTVTVTENITALKQRESSLRLLADASALLGGPLDGAGTLAQLARLLAERLGGYCVVELTGAAGDKRIAALAHHDGDLEPALESLVAHCGPGDLPPIPSARTFDTGEVTFQSYLEPRARRSAGRQVAALLRRLAPRSGMVVPIAGGGHVLGAISVVSVEGQPPLRPDQVEPVEEIGRRAGLALENSRLYREAQDAVVLRDQFLSMASHELRTPLTSLKGQLELGLRRLQRGASHEDIDRSMSVALAQAERLARLVGAMLDTSRLASGRLSIAPERISVVNMLGHVLDLERASEPPRTIVYAIDDDTAEVWGDLVRLEQVLVNLLQNARKYSPEESIIRLTVDTEPELVRIAVRDEGIGVPPEEQEQIFTSFQRASNVDRGIAGLGLGLAVAREIVHLHGGSLTLSSKLGAGSTFLLTLPRFRIPARTS